MKSIGIDTDAIYVNKSDIVLDDLFDYYGGSVLNSKNDSCRVSTDVNIMILNSTYGSLNK